MTYFALFSERVCEVEFEKYATVMAAITRQTGRYSQNSYVKHVAKLERIFCALWLAAKPLVRELIAAWYANRVGRAADAEPVS